jgi:hypothetical protein
VAIYVTLNLPSVRAPARTGSTETVLKRTVSSLAAIVISLRAHDFAGAQDVCWSTMTP